MNEDEKHDKIPEVWEGHNIADYIDPDIMKVSLGTPRLSVLTACSWVERPILFKLLNKSTSGTRDWLVNKPDPAVPVNYILVLRGGICTVE